MFKLLQMLGVLLLLAGIVFFFYYRNRRVKKTVVILCFLTIFSAGIANMVLDWIPMATEQITLTAKGEKSENAQSDEVALIGIIADGKTYEIQNAVEGKWFWQGNQYMWRNEGDVRQPKGTTRSITLNIPIGAGRALIFNNNPWRGMVDVTFKEETKTYDLYSEKGQDVQIAIPKTAPLYDNAIKMGRLALFGIFILILMTYPLFAASHFSDERIWEWLENNFNRLIYIFLALCCFVVMFYNGDKASFWYDEVWNVGWTYSGNPNKDGKIFQWLYDSWFFIVPYGQRYLLIISELLTAISVYVLGMAGRLYKNERFGVILAALCATSFPAIVQGGSEFRPYALLLFSVSMLAYLFIKKQKEQYQKKSTLILYVAILLLTMDTHPFGFVVAGLLMMFDFGLIIIRKVKLSGLLEFVLPGIYGMYWIWDLDVSAMSSYGDTWGTAPSIRGMISVVKELCNNSDVLLSLFLIGIVISGIYLSNRLHWQGEEFWKSYTILTFLANPILLFLLTCLYTGIFRGASVFVNRYFLTILPNCLFFIAVATDIIIEKLKRIHVMQIVKAPRCVFCPLF